MKIIFWITLLLPLATFAQVSDDFESGTVSSWIFCPPGQWAADNTNSISGAYSLHHIYDNSEAGMALAGLDISTLRSDLGNITWQFKIGYGCDPSASNNWGVYLISDQDPTLMDPSGVVSGYIAGVNLTGYDDTIRIWRVESGRFTAIVNTGINWQTDIGTSDYASFVIERSIGGDWSISVGVGISKPEVAGIGHDEIWFSNHYFGIYYRYTSSRDRLFWFDDLMITGVFIEDLIPPKISSAQFSSTSDILLVFNESVSDQMLTTDNFSIEGIQISPFTLSSSGDRILLKFQHIFDNKREYRLLINRLCDINGNCSIDFVVTLTLAYPEWGDIIISEFMADPDPAVGLPDCEYAELFNTSDFNFELTSLSLDIGSRHSKLPATKFAINSYVIVSDEDCDWSALGDRELISIKDFPLIPNKGGLITLSDSTGESIHGLEFNTSWFNDILKSEGGWSMEMVDTDYPFQSGENWKFSTDRSGGTPGYENSVARYNPDNEAPWIDNIYPESETELVVLFSEPVRVQSDIDKSWVDGCEIVNLSDMNLLKSAYRLSLDKALIPGRQYLMEIPDQVTDFNNNTLSRSTLGFGITESPEWNDIVINEILFDALPGESEFIEIYNRSDHIFDASELFLVSVNSQSGDTGAPAWLSDLSRCIMPGDYFVICPEKASILEIYSSSDRFYIFEPEVSPSLPDDEGLILLMSREHDIIDRVSYSKDMHFDLLSVTEGISLERIDAFVSSESLYNWHSASGISGWGTPGIKNSVIAESFQSGIDLSSRKISPDNDGYEDILRITVNAPEAGTVIRAIIYNDMGIRVRTISNHINGGGENNFYWDGTSDSGSSLPGGIYIIFVELTGSRGERSAYKKVCAIVR